MAIGVQCDRKGRLYLNQALRARYGRRFIILEQPDGLLLLSVPADPVAHLERLGEAVAHKSLAELKEDIRQQAEEEAAA